MLSTNIVKTLFFYQICRPFFTLWSGLSPTTVPDYWHLNIVGRKVRIFTRNSPSNVSWVPILIILRIPTLSPMLIFLFILILVSVLVQLFKYTIMGEFHKIYATVSLQFLHAFKFICLLFNIYKSLEDKRRCRSTARHLE